MISFGFKQPLFYPFELSCGSGNALSRLLLKGVQNINGVAESDGINRAPGIAVVRGYNLDGARAPKSFQRFCSWVNLATLCCEERVSDI